MKKPGSSFDYFIDLQPKPANFLNEVKDGFSQVRKSISPKFFYDKIGSSLFNDICDTEEYYLTRTELGLLRTAGEELAALAGKSRIIIEYGCGSSLKIAALLRELNEPQEYLAIDISKAHLLQTVNQIATNFPGLRIGAICADFTKTESLPTDVGGAGKLRVAFFPGSTIGNLKPNDSIEFLTKIRDVVGASGNLLIGVDLKKDAAILNAAYNDSRGITAAFNLNLLVRMQRELDAKLDLSGFQHSAFYNPQEGRVEMHLVSRHRQDIIIDNTVFEFNKNETIHTEHSYKYSLEEFSDLIAQAGFAVIKSWLDDKKLFSLQYLEVI